MGEKKERVEFRILEGVDISVDNGVFTIKGEKGEAKRNLFHPQIKAEVKDGKVTFQAFSAGMTEKKLMHTYRAHVRNLMRGVTKGITYKLKVCSSHFPMSVAVNDNTFQVKNFIGERTPRTMKLPEGVNAKVEGDDITLEGVDKEVVGQAAASIEKLTRRRGFDHRIFQDGIYITEKDRREMA